MNTNIADIYMGKLFGAVYVDKITGLVRLYEKKIMVQENPPVFITRYMPLSCKVSDPEKCSDTDMMIPDKNLKSVIWFEDGGAFSTKRESKAQFYFSTLRMVVWLNLKFFNHSGCSISAEVFQDINARFFNDRNENYNGYQRFHTLKLIQDAKSKDIFSRYSFADDNMFLNYPFDYFAVTIETEFSIHQSCKPEITLSDDPDCFTP